MDEPIHFCAEPQGQRQGTVAYWAGRLRRMSLGPFTYENGVRTRRSGESEWTVQVCRYQGYEVDDVFDLWGAAYVVWLGDSHWQPKVDARVACAMCGKKVRLASRLLLWCTPCAHWICAECAQDHESLARLAHGI